MAEWESIETAPKDGTRVLLFWPSYRYGGFDDPEPLIAIGRYKLNYRIRDAKPEHRAGLLDSYFADTDEGDDYGCAQPEHQPTHWMPLPDPPSVIDPQSNFDDTVVDDGGWIKPYSEVK